MFKVLKAILRIFLILITSTLITTLIIIVPVTKMVFNQKDVVKVLDNSDIYKNVNEEVKKSAIDVLNEALEEAPDDVREAIDVEELVNAIDISDLLRKVTNEVIDIAYSVTESEIKLTDIVNRYLFEFDDYIAENNIKIDEKTLNDIHNALSEDTLKEVAEEDEINDTLKQVKDNVDVVKAYAFIIEAALVVVILVLTGIILLLANNRTVSLVALLSIPAATLMLIELLLTVFIKEGSEEMGKLLYGITSSIKNTMFDYINIAIIILVLIIIGLIVFKVVRNKKKAKDKTVSE